MPRVYGEPRNMITLYYFVIGGSIFFFSFLFSFPRIIQAFEMIIARIYRFFYLTYFCSRSVFFRPPWPDARLCSTEMS